jgi:hypothetical protein
MLSQIKNLQMCISGVVTRPMGPFSVDLSYSIFNFIINLQSCFVFKTHFIALLQNL